MQERLDEEVAGIAGCVARIHEAGALVKDLDQGLVDFPAQPQGEPVLLCWRLGEDESATGTASKKASRAESHSPSNPHPGGEMVHPPPAVHATGEL